MQKEEDRTASSRQLPHMHTWRTHILDDVCHLLCLAGCGAVVDAYCFWWGRNVLTCQLLAGRGSCQRSFLAAGANRLAAGGGAAAATAGATSSRVERAAPAKQQHWNDAEDMIETLVRDASKAQQCSHGEVKQLPTRQC
jgi:hypothetical protein